MTKWRDWPLAVYGEMPASHSARDRSLHPSSNPKVHSWTAYHLGRRRSQQTSRSWLLLVEVKDGRAPVKLLNISDQVVTVRRNMKVATLSCMQIVCPVPSSPEGEMMSSDQVVNEAQEMPEDDLSGAALSPSERKAVQRLLSEQGCFLYHLHGCWLYFHSLA